MTFTSIPSAAIEIGEPVTHDLMNTIKGNLDDLNVRLSAFSINAGSEVFVNQLEKRPKDSLPVGSIVFASLDSAQFAAETDGGEWVAANGANVAGSDWSTVTGRTVLPDIRGRFIRAKDNAAGNAPVDSALDSFTADSLKSHLHDMGHGHGHNITASTSNAADHAHKLAVSGTGPGGNPLQAYNPIGANPHYLHANVSAPGTPGSDYSLQGVSGTPTLGITDFAGGHNHPVSIAGGVSNMSGNTGSTGASETAPRYITENVFIKINRAYIGTNTRQFAIRVPQQTILNNILVSPVQQGTSGNLVIDIKKGNTIATATQSIFQSGQLPTLVWNATSGVTGLTDSNQNTVEAGQFIVVSITATQAKLKEFHLFIAGDL